MSCAHAQHRQAGPCKLCACMRVRAHACTPAGRDCESAVACSVVHCVFPPNTVQCVCGGALHALAGAAWRVSADRDLRAAPPCICMPVCKHVSRGVAPARGGGDKRAGA